MRLFGWQSFVERYTIHYRAYSWRDLTDLPKIDDFGQSINQISIAPISPGKARLSGAKAASIYRGPDVKGQISNDQTIKRRNAPVVEMHIENIFVNSPTWPGDDSAEIDDNLKVTYRNIMPRIIADRRTIVTSQWLILYVVWKLGALSSKQTPTRKMSIWARVTGSGKTLT